MKVQCKLKKALLMPVIPELRQLKQEDYQVLVANLVYIISSQPASTTE